MAFTMRAACLAGTLALLPAGVDAEPIALAAALEQADANSPRIAVSEAQLRAAEALARQAGLRPNPVASVQAENFAGTGAYFGLSASEVTLEFSQQVERGGKRSARRALAAAQRDHASLALTRTRADLALEVRRSFAELAAVEDRAVLARENAARAAQFAQAAAVLVEAGRDPPWHGHRHSQAPGAITSARANLSQRSRAAMPPRSPLNAARRMRGWLWRNRRSCANSACSTPA